MTLCLPLFKPCIRLLHQTLSLSALPLPFLSHLTKDHPTHSLSTITWLSQEHTTHISSCNSKIKAFGRAGKPEEARLLFDKMSQRDSVTWNSMITCYCQNGILDQARLLFDAMPKRNVVSWNTMMTGYSQNQMLEEARRLFDKMPNKNLVSWNAIVTAYCNLGLIKEATELFDLMPERNWVSWVVLISGYLQVDEFARALLVFLQMRRAGILVSQSGISMAITASSSLDNMYLVQNLHNLAIKTGFVRDVKVGTSILNAYAKLGELNSASLFFESMPVINGFSRTTMIKAYAGNGRLDEACKIYENASEKTLSTHTAMITGFAQNGRILEAREVFNGILKPDVVSWTAMVAGYAQNSMLEEARALFDKMLDKNSVTWATMVSGYAQHEKWEQALMVFSELHREGILPRHWTYTTAINACANSGRLELGKQIHSLSIKTGCQFNPFVSNGLITMYAKCKHIEDASWQFSSITIKDKLQWSSLVSEFSQNHALEEARHVFDKMGIHDIISWTSMISVYIQAGHSCEAIELFTTMLDEGLKPNPYTITSILCICADLGVIELGKQIHGMAIRLWLDNDVYVSSAMMSMYFKCDSTANAFRLLNLMHHRDLITWNMLLDGCARHGLGMEAVQAYEEMIAEGVALDHSTFMGLLCACSHECMIEEGRRYFDSMSKDHGLMPHDGHYACMVGLLGQFGLLSEAEKFIRNMPIEPDLEVWEALLWGCKAHLDVQLGNRVAELLFRFEPDRLEPYILLLNIYMDLGMWTEVEELRKMMKEQGAMRESGCCSWIHVKNRVHWFFTGDERHEEREETYWRLGELYEHLRSCDYMLETEFVMDGLEEEDFIGERLPWLLATTIDLAGGAIQCGQRL